MIKKRLPVESFIAKGVLSEKQIERT